MLKGWKNTIFEIQFLKLFYLSSRYFIEVIKEMALVKLNIKKNMWKDEG